jgi:hypothetical protein
MQANSTGVVELNWRCFFEDVQFVYAGEQHWCCGTELALFL